MSPSRPDGRPPIGERELATAALFLLPVAVWFVVRYQPDRVTTAVSGLVAMGVILLAARAPQQALILICAIVPFQALASAWLYHLGVPGGLVASMGLWKEVVLAGIVVAALLHARRSDRLDVLDGLALLFLANNVLYRVWPSLFVRPVVGGFVPDGGTMDIAFRNGTLLVVVLLAVRHLPWSADQRERFQRTLVIVGTTLAGIAIYEYLRSDSWNRFLVETIGYPAWHAEVVHAPVLNPTDIRVYTAVAGRDVVRVGSVLVDQLVLAAYLIPPLAILLERLVHGRPRPGAAIALPMIVVGLVLTQTRGMIAAAAIVVLLAVRPLPGHDRGARTRVLATLALSLIPLIPLVFTIGLADRARETVAFSDSSTQAHRDRTREAWDRLVERPLGGGLGTLGETARRGGVTSTTYTENQYLEVGNETGALAAGLLVALVLVAGRRLWHRQQAPGADPMVATWFGVLVALALGGLVMAPWSNLIAAWPVFAGLGMVLPPARRAVVGPRSARIVTPFETTR